MIHGGGSAPGLLAERQESRRPPTFTGGWPSDRSVYYFLRVERAVVFLAAGRAFAVAVDLEDKTVRAKDFTAPFHIDDYTRWRLLEGLDDIALTLRHSDAIGAFEGGRPRWKPTTTSTLPS